MKGTFFSKKRKVSIFVCETHHSLENVMLPGVES